MPLSPNGKFEKCAKCQKSIWIPPYRRKSYIGRKANKHFFCSKECAKIGMIRKKGKDHWQWKGGIQKKQCEHCHKFYNCMVARIKVSKFCSSKCWGKYWSAIHKNSYLKKKKKSNPLRGGKKYKIWRNSILLRDKFCVICKIEKSIIAHHIISIKENPKLIYETSNGIALCLRCHYNLHYK